MDISFSNINNEEVDNKEEYFYEAFNMLDLENKQNFNNKNVSIVLFTLPFEGYLKEDENLRKGSNYSYIKINQELKSSYLINKNNSFNLINALFLNNNKIDGIDLSESDKYDYINNLMSFNLDNMKLINFIGTVDVFPYIFNKISQPSCTIIKISPRLYFDAFKKIDGDPNIIHLGLNKLFISQTRLDELEKNKKHKYFIWEDIFNCYIDVLKKLFIKYKNLHFIIDCESLESNYFPGCSNPCILGLDKNLIFEIFKLFNKNIESIESITFFKFNPTIEFKISSNVLINLIYKLIN